MIENDNKIRKSMPARRDPTCLETRHAILIPAGTMLRQDKPGVFTCPVAGGVFTFSANPDEFQGSYKKVMSV
jgi:hypothetical protein